MSRIFDALQRSGTEQSGIAYPDMVSVATEVFEAPGRQGSSDQAVTDQPPTLPPPVVQLTEVIAQELGKIDQVPTQFPSVEVRVAPSSRLVYFTEPDGMAAEKFRFLGVRLRQLQQNRLLKKVLVTSTIPQEGKSLVSANLAGVLAQRKQNVLLLDGDLRQPVLAQQFGLGRLAGLGEWLQSGLRTASNIYRLGTLGFWLMPAGDPSTNPIELMQSGRLSELMGQLATMFDWIIVDSPPLLPLADATVWARLTDGILLVAREGKTEKAPLQHGLEILKKSDLLGVVLNGCIRTDSTNYYQRYSANRTKEPRANS